MSEPAFNDDRMIDAGRKPEDADAASLPSPAGGRGVGGEGGNMKPFNVNRARSLRKNANTPEQIAWEVLRGFRKQRFPVRRQHPVGRFIVDFAIVKEKLVIEIDGGVHRLPDVAEKDATREKEITEQGWRVLLIPAETAMSKEHLCALVQKELGL